MSVSELSESLPGTEPPVLEPLERLRLGARGTIMRLVGRKEDDARLESIGLRPGVEVEVAKRGRFGPLILCCGPMRVALDRRLARELVVAVTSTPDASRLG